MKVRFIAWASLSAVLLSQVLALCQEPPRSNDAAPVADDSAIRQEILARQFREFEQALLRLAQRLERSSKPEDRERAAHLKKAIAVASDVGVDNKFDRLVSILRGSRSLSLQEIQEAMAQNRMLADDIRAILALLLADNRDDEIKREKQRMAAILKRLQQIIREQKIVRANTEAGRMEKDQLGDTQKKITQRTQGLARDMQGKKADGSNKEPSEGKNSDSRPDSQDPGKTPGKGGSQGKEQPGKNGNPQPGPSEQTEGTPGQKHVQDASEQQRQAEEKLRGNDRQTASKKQDKAIEELEKAQQKLEEVLKQLREEEAERLLAALQQRCERMLQMQIEVHEGTVRIDHTIAANPDHKASRVDEQHSLQLSDREEEIIRDADKAIQILQAEGSAVAFPEVFIQVREDMKHVARRLGKADVASITQTIEQDIIAILREMIDALKRAQQRLQQQRSQPSNSQSQNQKLIDILAELKMIRAMQLRVNVRTHLYGEKYQGEQAVDADIQKELVDLAQRQQKVYEITNAIYRGENR